MGGYGKTANFGPDRLSDPFKTLFVAVAIWTRTRVMGTLTYSEVLPLLSALVFLQDFFGGSSIHQEIHSNFNLASFSLRSFLVKKLPPLGANGLSPLPSEPEPSDNLVLRNLLSEFQPREVRLKPAPLSGVLHAPDNGARSKLLTEGNHAAVLLH